MEKLTKSDLDRYDRQIIIEEIGRQGQEKLKNARVTIVGAGGLGSSVSMYLVAAGIGEITIIDGDSVSLSNLNRQILHGESAIGKSKVESAIRRLKDINSDIIIKGICDKVTDDNVLALMADSMAIIDCLDNFLTRFILNRAALKLEIPLFFGACYGFEGRVSVIIPGKTPCLECLLKSIPPPEKVPVLGATPGVIGAIQATEVIKYFIGIKPTLAGKLLLYDGKNNMYETIEISRDPDCRACGTSHGRRNE